MKIIAKSQPVRPAGQRHCKDTARACDPALCWLDQFLRRRPTGGQGEGDIAAELIAVPLYRNRTRFLSTISSRILLMFKWMRRKRSGRATSITGDEKPEAIAHKAQSVFSEELQKKLEKTGLSVQHVTADTAPSDNSLVVQGSFLALRQGMKTERVVVGMGTGSAALQAKVDVRLKTPTDDGSSLAVPDRDDEGQKCGSRGPRCSRSESRGGRGQIDHRGSQENTECVCLQDR